MKGRAKKFLALLLALVLALGIMPQTAYALTLPELVAPRLPRLQQDLDKGAYASLTAATLDGTQSAWAEEELKKAYAYGLTYPDIMKNFSAAITREEFCTIVVKLYEQLTGKTAEPGADPFTDTDNPEILKAYNLKIVYGTAADKFSPASHITRQEICVMIFRALDVGIPGLDKSAPAAFDFTDAGKIASWAIDAVKFAYKNEIMKGTGNNQISPLDNTTREQAIVLLKRTYEQYSGADTGSAGQELFAESLISAARLKPSETEKLAAIDFNARFFRPIYKPLLNLSAAGKAGAWPVISPAGGGKQVFQISAETGALAGAKNIVWQVSRVPFDGGPVRGGTPKPGGLLLSGVLPSTASSFSVDLEAALAAMAPAKSSVSFTPTVPKLTPSLTPTVPKLIPNILLPGAKPMPGYGNTSLEPLHVFYVRAYGADAAGNSIGDGGAGFPVLYGDPLAGQKGKFAFTVPFSLTLAERSGTPTYGKEFPNTFVDKVERTLTSDSSSKAYHVLPAGFSANVKELRLQVSLTDFSSNANDSWRNVAGLAYEASIFPGSPAFAQLSGSQPQGFAIDFAEFVPADSALPEKDYIPYYIRAVALTESGQAGAMNADYSRTVRVNYGKPQAADFKFYPTIEIAPPVPVLQQVSYTPIQWEATDWQYHYVVTRQPTEREVFGPAGSATKLYAPYTVGTKLDFTPPPPEKKSWWEEAWDSITSFFSDLISFVAKVVNWVSKAYADLKAGVINIVVSALPDVLQGPMRMALTAVVDYGLVAIGIPPTLPNFDDLANMGVDYLAATAMEAAGVPAGSLMEYGVNELADELEDSLTACAKSGAPNPMDWDFIKLDPDYLYRPAYLMLELYNPYDFPTPEGLLHFRAETDMDLSKNGFDPQVTRLYGAYGTGHLSLYKPVFGFKIPALDPGQHLTVPVFLEEYVGLPFPGGSASVQGMDYPVVYTIGAYEFNLNLQYELPPIQDEIKRQGYTAEAIYSYSSLGNSRSFTIKATDSYSK